MVRLLIGWALNNPLIVILLSFALIGFGVYAFQHVNVEAYPDPAPPLVEVIAQFPGASAEDVERRVTVPLEVTLAGMPGLTVTRSKSLFGLCDIHCQFAYGTDYLAARQEVINRLQFTQPLPPGVQPVLSPESPTGEIYRYTLNCPKDPSGQDIYTLNDLKALQDWVLEREFRRVDRIVDVSSFGGTVKRYEIHPDPEKMKQQGITLAQIQTALTNANQNVGGDIVNQGTVAMPVRSIGVLAAGQDPVNLVLGMKDPDPKKAEELEKAEKDNSPDRFQLKEEQRVRLATAAAKKLREEENDRIREIRAIVITSINNEAKLIDSIVEGHPVLAPWYGLSEKSLAALRRAGVPSSDFGLPAFSASTVGLLGSSDGQGPLLAASALFPGRIPVSEWAEPALRATSIVGLLGSAAGHGPLLAASALFPGRIPVLDKLRAAFEDQDVATKDEFLQRLKQVLGPDELERFEKLVLEHAWHPPEQAGASGVVVGNQTRLGRVSLAKPKEIQKSDATYRVVDDKGNLVWRNERDKVQCIVLLRKGEDSLPALKDVEKKVAELNDPASGKLLPGVVIEPYYDRTELINVTTETVRENLLMGVLLVMMVLFMFISNVRAALIVAINIPLALLFAFSVLFMRGKSANLLSIGAVDFGIIVDSSVIMVENIYRHISSGEYPELPLKDRILRACHEVEKPLLFSTLIMVCAFLPLFTMTGPEGALFGPMAQTYGFALGGALFLALTLAPVMCLLFFKHLKPAPDNFLVRWLKNSYLRQLDYIIQHRWIAVAIFTVLIAFTAVYALPRLGHEFMPELEEGNLWVRGTFPLNISLERVTENSEEVRRILTAYEEVETAVVQIGRPDDGTDSTGFFNIELFVPLRPEKQWPQVVDQTGWRRRLHGAKRARTKLELVKEMNDELSRKVPGVDFNFSQNIRDNVMEALSGIKGDNSVKIVGPDLEKLDDLAEKVQDRLRLIQGVENVGIFRIKGQTNLEFVVDKAKCKKYGVSANDVNTVVQTALGGKAYSTMIEGEKQFDITVRWPKWRRSSVASILDIPVDITNNQLVPAAGPSATPSPYGTGHPPPPKVGAQVDTTNPIATNPRLRLGDLVTPPGRDGKPDPSGSFVRSGASTIYREQGQRLIAVKFSVRDRDLASAVAEAQDKTRDLLQAPYRAEWSGEFQEMEDAEKRLMIIIPLSLSLIFVLLYLAFRSLIDTVVVLANVVALSLGGIWALLLTNTNFSISAAVGFISIFGVAVMDGLLLISYFNQERARGFPLREAILRGGGKRVRAMMMTDLTAVFGLLPAAFSTRIGAQTQRPLAIVVVGGMVTTLLLTRYLMPLLYSFYGHREPPAGASDMAH